MSVPAHKEWQTSFWWNDDWARTAEAICARVNIGMHPHPLPKPAEARGSATPAEMDENSRHQAEEEALEGDPDHDQGDGEIPF